MNDINLRIKILETPEDEKCKKISGFMVTELDYKIIIAAFNKWRRGKNKGIGDFITLCILKQAMEMKITEMDLKE